MTFNPEISDEALSRVLADPEAIKVLEVLAAREGISTPFLEIHRDKQIELVAKMMEMARAAQEQADGSNPPIDAQSIPDEIVVQVFSDPRADKLLREIMSQSDLTGEPADLPFNIKQAIVSMMVERGIIRFGPE